MAVSEEKKEAVTLEPVASAPIPLEPLKKKKGAKGAVAGVALITAGIFALLSWACVVILFKMIKADFTMQIIGALWVAIFATLALLGGILALRRIGWKTSLVCSILGILSFGFFVSIALCAFAIIILLFAKKEFS